MTKHARVFVSSRCHNDKNFEISMRPLSLMRIDCRMHRREGVLHEEIFLRMIDI